MVSNEHEARTEGMRILRDVGSSLEYTGPIRTRPKPSFHTNSYEVQPSVSIQNSNLMNVTLVPDCTQVPALQLKTPSTDIIQPPTQYMQQQPMTRQQPLQHSYYNPILLN